jgi:hypothetical protein
MKELKQNRTNFHEKLKQKDRTILFLSQEMRSLRGRELKLLKFGNIILYLNLAIFGSELIAKRSGSTKSQSLIDLYEAAQLEMSTDDNEEDEQTLEGI